MSRAVRPRRRSVLAVAGVWGLWIAVLISGFFGPDDATWSDVPIVVGYGLVLALGSLLVLKVQDNAVSWVMLALGAAAGLLNVTATISAAGDAAGLPAVHEVFAYLNLASLFGIVVLGGALLPLLFPTGSPPSPRWRWAAASALAGYATILVSVPIVRAVYGFEASEDIAQGDIGLLLPVQFVGMGLMLIGIAASVVSLAVRWHRSDGDERAQLQWLVPTFIVFGIGLVAEFGGAQDSPIADVFLALGIVLVPVSIGFAITKYRLYDIGKIVSRTVTYAVLAVLIAAAFGAGAVWLPTRLGFEQPTFVAATTLAIAIGFNPLRRWLTTRLDRRFNRTPYDREVVVDALASELRDSTDVSAIMSAWAQAAQRTLHPGLLSVWVAERAGEEA